MRSDLRVRQAVASEAGDLLFLWGELLTVVVALAHFLAGCDQLPAGAFSERLHTHCLGASHRYPCRHCPAGGKFSQGVDGERVEIDALDFIRTLSGRLTGTGVLSHPLPL